MLLDDRLQRLHPLQRLQSGLRLPGLRRLGAEALDERLHVLAGGVLLGDRLAEKFQLFGALPLEAVVVAAIEDELLLVEMDDRVDRVVQDVAIVADDEDGVG